MSDASPPDDSGPAAMVRAIGPHGEVSYVRRADVGLTIEERAALIEAAFRELPSRNDDGSSGLPYDRLIPHMPRQFLRECGMGPDSENPHFLPAASKKVEDELGELKKAAEKLLSAAEELHKPTWELLWGAPPAHLETEMKVLIEIINMVQIPPDLPSARGAREKLRALKVARLAAEHYWRLTGRKPTVTVNPDTNQSSGPFLDLLRKVYKALDIEASVESQAKALKQWGGAPWPK